MRSSFVISEPLKKIIILEKLGESRFSVFSVIGLIILRRKEPNLPRPYRTWGYPVTPILFIIISAGVLINAFVIDFTRPLTGLIILAVGLPFYFFWKKNQTTQE